MSTKYRRRSNSVLKRISIRLLKLILFVGIPFLLFLYLFRLDHVSVTGITKYSEEQIADQFKRSRMDENTLLMYLKYSYFEDLKIPFVEKYHLKVVNNHSIHISMYEKMVIGCVEFMGEYLYFDKDGIVVESSPTQLEDIPLIKGLRFNRIVLNEKLNVQKDELFDVILNLTQLVDKLELDIDKIIFSSNYEVTVECDKIRASLGRRSTYDEVLAELKNIILSVDENASLLTDAEGTQIVLDMTKYSKDTNTIFAKPKKQQK